MKRLVVIELGVLLMIAPVQCLANDPGYTSEPLEFNWNSIQDLRSMDGTQALDTAAALLQSAQEAKVDRIEAVRKRIMALVLVRRFMPDCESLEERCQAVQASLSKLETGILSSGGDQTMITRGSASLESIVGRRPATIAFKVSARLPTVAERKLLVNAVIARLVDPTAPIFGAAHLVGKKACMTVNSKNSFGGYTGNQEAMIFLVSGKWRVGGTMRTSHEECVSSLTQM